MRTMADIDRDYPDFNYEAILSRGEKAFLFDIDGDGTRKIWLPISEFELDENNKMFNIPRWLAEKKELILSNTLLQFQQVVVQKPTSNSKKT